MSLPVISSIAHTYQMLIFTFRRLNCKLVSSNSYKSIQNNIPKQRFWGHFNLIYGKIIQINNEVTFKEGGGIDYKEKGKIKNMVNNFSDIITNCWISFIFFRTL